MKPKQNYARSVKFWRDQGFDVVTLADEGPPSYDGMARLFARYERIVSCTFSSAIFFGAALGKPVDLIHGFRCRAWEVAEIEHLFNFNSAAAQKVGQAFATGSDAAKIELSRYILGSELDQPATSIREELNAVIAELRAPLHFAGGLPRSAQWILCEAALRLGKPRLARLRPREIITRLMPPRIFLQELDEISLWLHGRTADYPRLIPTRHVRGKTIPGDAVESY